ncbi:four helix bundle protein [Marivirga sericea]|uniref:Four helix bundle protein n=1 Tax=Marivirga sericea TaxID=1028 RepID=A0A1X7HZI3_9BACT|nr:four helix bundle protein [Marivirga sericea]SMG07461.1 four helix bundle protein [Marivirga sericea]
MSFKFENLRIWHIAMDFGEDLHNLSKNFPKDEVFNLTSQVRRAADSIALNISEGSILQSAPEYKRFLSYSIRSLAEVVTCLHKAKRRKYIDGNQFQTQYNQAYNLMNMMVSFRSKIK